MAAVVEILHLEGGVAGLPPMVVDLAGEAGADRVTADISEAEDDLAVVRLDPWTHRDVRPGRRGVLDVGGGR